MAAFTTGLREWASQIWELPPHTSLEHSPYGLYALLGQGRSILEIQQLWQDVMSQGGTVESHARFVRTLIGPMPAEPFHCGIWRDEFRFKAICPHNNVAYLAHGIIEAFLSGTPSPLLSYYPGFSAAQRGVIAYMTEVDSVYGDLALTIWTRMNALRAFTDPAQAAKKYTEAYCRAYDGA